MTDKNKGCRPENRNKSGTFRKGMSGNPGGRPKLPDEFKQLAKENATIALRKVVEILNDPEAEDKDKLRAAEIIMDRAYGKAKQEIDASIAGAVPVKIVDDIE